ncbi:MAG TPA: ferritin-like domain-containing protein [Candidatus Binatia bacterium]|nr:ferritin-like domain-containing protein [Candidatus Binatia bacterium]
MIELRIGSNEHKELFCRTFVESHRAYDPKDWPWPELDDLSLARLRAIPIWTMALEVEQDAGVMLEGYAKTEGDPIVREALALQGYEEARHGRILQCMIDRYGLKVTPESKGKEPTRDAFIGFGYDECVDSFAGFGIFRLARDARILPESLTSLFSRVLVEEARHIVFFVNWVAWDRTRRGLRGPLMQAIPALLCYGSAVTRRVKGGSEMAGSAPKNEQPEDMRIDLFGEVLSGLTPTAFLRACVEENDRYMAAFDQRLLRPRVIPTLGKFALAILETIDRIRAFPKSAPPSPSSG